MKLINKYLITLTSLTLIVALFGVFWITKKTNQKPTKTISPTYNQVVSSKTNVEKDSDYFSSSYDGQQIEWKAKISNYYSQLTGIKFCVVDNEHPDVNIDNTCNWFWASSDKIMNADDLKTNPNWDGKWVNYILNYYKVAFNPNDNFYNDVYTIKGIVNGIDCAPDPNNKCVPDIEIINITNN